MSPISKTSRASIAAIGLNDEDRDHSEGITLFPVTVLQEMRQDTPTPPADPPASTSTFAAGPPLTPPLPSVPPCSGWECYNSGQQFGILFSVISSVALLGFLYYYLAIKHKVGWWRHAEPNDDDNDNDNDDQDVELIRIRRVSDDLFLVRTPSAQRTRRRKNGVPPGDN